MDINSTVFFFDEANIICPIHEIPTIGVCSEYMCPEKRILCMKCLDNMQVCIRSDKHELITLAELFYRFFIRQENKTLDLLDFNLMLEQIKTFDKMETFKQLSEFGKLVNQTLDKRISDFEANQKENISDMVNTYISDITKLESYFDSHLFNPELTKLKIPDFLLQAESSVRETLNSKDVNLNTKKDILSVMKYFTNNSQVKSDIEVIDNILYAKYFDEGLLEVTKDKVAQKLKSVEDKLNEQLDALENAILPSKEGVTLLKDLNKKFVSSPVNLTYKMDICDTAHKSNSIDSVFCVFKTIKGEIFAVWGTSTFYISAYDLNAEKLTVSVPAHSSTIFACRHYLDKRTKIDMIVTSSYDKSVKVWNFNTGISNILTLSNAHTGYYIYSACILCDELENKNYVISSAPNEYSKVWDFNGKVVKEFGVNNESTYFVSTWLDLRQRKYYIIIANSTDVKFYEFKTGSLFKSFKGTPQTWHMSAHVVERDNFPFLIESDGSGNVRMWDIYKGTQVCCIPTSGINLRGLCIWNDQYVIASGSDYTAKVYDMVDKKLVKTLSSHTSTVCAVNKIMIPKYGECLITHGLDGKLKLWTGS